MYNLTQCLLKKSKLAKHVNEEIQKLGWKEAKVLQIEPHITYGKCNESSHMSLLDHFISQPGLDISPIWSPIIAAEVSKLQFHPV
jgi:hypothetical protein